MSQQALFPSKQFLPIIKWLPKVHCIVSLRQPLRIDLPAQVFELSCVGEAVDGRLEGGEVDGGAGRSGEVTVKKVSIELTSPPISLLRGASSLSQFEER